MPSLGGTSWRLVKFQGGDGKTLTPDEQERLFLAALEAAATWAIEGDTLDLRRKDGSRLVQAKRVVK